MSSVIVYSDTETYRARIRLADHVATIPNFSWSDTPIEASVNQIGLDKLMFSSSAQFYSGNINSLRAILEDPARGATTVVVIDLRREGHGNVFSKSEGRWADGQPYNSSENSYSVAFKLNNFIASAEIPTHYSTNQQLTSDQIEAKERLLGQSLLKQHFYDTDKTDKSKIELELTATEFLTERELVEGLGPQFAYERIAASDEMFPEDEAIEKLIGLIKNRKEGDWWHIHCAGGQGRSTTFKVLVDIIYNNNNVSFDEVLYRQHLIGGSNLKDIAKDPFGHKERRLQLLEQFYHYCQQEGPDFKTRWSERSDSIQST